MAGEAAADLLLLTLHFLALAARLSSVQVAADQVAATHRQARQSLTHQRAGGCARLSQAAAVQQERRGHPLRQAAQARREIVNSAERVAAAAVRLLQLLPLRVPAVQVERAAAVAVAVVLLWLAAASVARVALVVPVTCASLAGKKILIMSHHP